MASLLPNCLDSSGKSYVSHPVCLTPMLTHLSPRIFPGWRENVEDTIWLMQFGTTIFAANLQIPRGSLASCLNPKNKTIQKTYNANQLFCWI